MKDPQDNLEFQITQYLDGRLSREDARSLLEKIQADSRLQQEYRLYEKLDELLVDMKVDDRLDHVDFDAQRRQVMSRIERQSLLEPAGGSRVFRIGYDMLAAAAAVVIAMAAGLVYHSMQSGDIQPQTVAVVDVATVPETGQANQDGQTLATLASHPSQQLAVVTCQVDKLTDEQVAREMAEHGGLGRGTHSMAIAAEIPSGSIMVFASGSNQPQIQQTELYAF